MIQSKRTNEPLWHDVYTYSSLPESLSQLEEIAHNLWWVWDSDARSLFHGLNEEVWEETNGNPVKVLRALTQKKLKEIEADDSFKAKIARVYARFKAYMEGPYRTDAPSVAYFSMEYGLTNILKIYSGGLGVLAGDFMKEASDSNVDMVGVGFLYRYGYFDQVIANDGHQMAEYKAQRFNELPITQVKTSEGKPLMIAVPYPERTVYANVWQVAIGRVTLYLLDTDVADNSEWDRSITHQLYGGDWENRMKQEYLLGIGGILMLEQLGIKKDIYHCNEGHAAFINVQRLAHLIEKEGLNFNEALEVVRASSLYTVHTPVPAGHDYFDEALFGKYMNGFHNKLGITWQEFVDMGRENPGSNEKFSMSVFALNTCQAANGVSLLHGAVSQKMFAPVWKGFFPEELHVGYVTNGVHLPTWMASVWKPFVQKHISEDIIHLQDKEEVWNKIQEIPDHELWEMRKLMKQRFIDYVKTTYSRHPVNSKGEPSSTMAVIDKINPEALLIGFGRRFATYKRAHLLFTDLDRLAEIVNNEKFPVQFIFTGKAHPADGGGQGLIKHIVEISKRPEFEDKILFLENYDIRLAQRLIAGVDVWMNTPTRPLEASGTSGEKALMNGVLNLSVLDGWWYEGYREGAGWALTDKRTYTNQHFQDQLDAETIYDLLEDEIVPLYYERPEDSEFSPGWVKTIKNSMNFILPHYTMRRMMNDYIERFYRPLKERSARLNANNHNLVRDIVKWKEAVSANWHMIQVLDTQIFTQDGDTTTFIIGELAKISLTLDKHLLSCDLDVELVVAEEVEDKSLRLQNVLPFQLISHEGSRVVYELERVVDIPGYQKVAIRITPRYGMLPHKMDFAYVTWVPLPCVRKAHS
ncbi:alpha-glucan family phosphorylase [Porphyromonas sp.]|uniref:alpha-glucan family phosphorylase n=1 Tax=Porphyromonas sp. TaxID=1924944 RepID=UPI0026DD8B20|nr:alpha-glucan family phosphorylase [Porphyromonas sp.]MDO4695764.1 alpha-glucan family phosphorylase [Porphyromonas sp.]MDO4770471.1 alpha-glucan family phosphorylase [Porphyromonas sp.]